MGLYSDRIFPKILDLAMRAPELKPLRARTVKHAHGRVLKPGGEFFFMEHGRCPEPNIAKWAGERSKQHLHFLHPCRSQDRLTPAWKVIGDGCHLNRNIESLQNPVLPKAPEIVGYGYLGRARRGA